MRILKLLVLLCFTTVVFAQEEGESQIDLQLKKSTVFKDKKKFTKLAFSTEDGNNGVFVGRRYKKGYYIEHYDGNAKLLKNYDFPVDKKRGSIDAAFLSGNNLCLIEYLYNSKSKQLEYYTNTTPKDKFSFKRELLFSVPLKDIKKKATFFTFFGNGGLDNDVLGDYKISKDNKYIAFTVDIKNKDAEEHKIIVFDNALNKVYETEFVRGINDRKFVLQNIDIDENDGTVYLLGKSYTREKRKKTKGGKYQYELYKIKGSSKNSVVFDSNEKFIGSLTTVIQDGKLFCVGFYSDKNDVRYKGLVYFDVDAKTMSLKDGVYSPFTKQFIIDKYGKEKQKELRDITFRDIFVNDKGECILNAEEFFITVHTQMTQYGTTTYYKYHFYDIISAKLDANGKLLWARNINKKQVSGNDSPYMSYTSVERNGKVYFFINCADKIRKMRNDRIQFRGTGAKRSNLYVITLDNEGNYEYQKILDDKDTDVPFGVNFGIVTNEGKEIIFQGRKGSKKQVMKVILP